MYESLEQLRQHTECLAGKALPWLVALQAESWQKYKHQRLPTRKQADWKYTDIQFLEKLRFSLPPPAQDAKRHHMPSPLQNTHGIQICFVDGTFAGISNSCPPGDVIALPLAQACAKYPHIRQKYFTDMEAVDSLACLNLAFLQDGLFLQIPDNTPYPHLIHIQHLTTGHSTCAHMQNIRHILQIGTNSSATVFEEHRSLALQNNREGGMLLKNLCNDFSLEKGAKLSYCKLQTEDRQTTHLCQTRVTLAQDSAFNGTHVSCGAHLSREAIDVQLQAKGASCDLEGLYVPVEKQHMAYHTRMGHTASHTFSQQYYKGILAGHSKGVFDGKVHVSPKAQQIKSDQVNKNLLLSPTAQMNTKPALEIYADDVQCTHGATVGQLAESALFYLRTRGLTQQAAQRLLIQAFYTEIIGALKQDALRDHCLCEIAAQIRTGLKTDDIH